MYTKRRILRALFARLSRFLILICNYYIPNKYLHCVACGKETASFYIFEGRPFGCPYCNSSSRERFVLEAINNKLLPKSFSSEKIVHVAPGELSIARTFQGYGDYHAIDLNPGKYNGVKVEKVDLTEIDKNSKYNDAGLVYASHVLEHIPDDKKAMKSIFISLKSGGMAWFMVPLKGKKTKEGNESDSSKLREELYGQWDHVRLYGLDILDKLESVGFSVKIITIKDFLPEVVANSGLNPDDCIFLCKKP